MIKKGQTQALSSILDICQFVLLCSEGFCYLSTGKGSQIPSQINKQLNILKYFEWLSPLAQCLIQLIST